MQRSSMIAEAAQKREDEETSLIEELAGSVKSKWIMSYKLE